MASTDFERMTNATQLQSEYVAAQHRLLMRLSGVQSGCYPWPQQDEYEAIAQLGRLAHDELFAI
jgi:hypothetical protein